MKRSHCLLALFAIAGTSTLASAAPFDARLVGSDAKFVAFVDAERARETAVGGRLFEELQKNPDYIAFEQLMIQAAGFMPASDIRDITLWGEQHGRTPKALLVIRAGFDPQQLRSAVGFADEFDVDAYNGHELLSWKDQRKGNRVHATIFDGQTILMTGDPDTLKRGIDVLTDDHRSLASESPMPRPSGDAVWAFAAAIDIASTPDAPGNPVLSQLATAALELEENAGNETIARMTTVAIDDASGPRLLRLANGLKAMAEMGLAAKASAATEPAEGEPVDPQRAIERMMPALLESLQLTGDGRTVRGSLTMSRDTAVELVQHVVDSREALPLRRWRKP